LDHQEAGQVAHSAGVVVTPSELVAGASLPIEAEIRHETKAEIKHEMKAEKKHEMKAEKKHEMMRENNMMAKSEKESVHNAVVPMEMTVETMTVETTNTVSAVSKRKERHEKPDRRRNHPRGGEPPSANNDGAGRFAVPSTLKQKTPPSTTVNKQKTQSTTKQRTPGATTTKQKTQSTTKQRSPPSTNKQKTPGTSTTKQKTPGTQRHNGLGSKSEKTAP